MPINALVYVREYMVSSYRPIFEGLAGVDVSYVTDFSRPGMHSLREHFYRHFRKGSVDVPFDVSDIIARCRLLRNMPTGTASEMVGAMYLAVRDLLGAGRYTVVVGQMVDDYITHLFSLVARSQGINYIGLCEGYFPDTSQISLHSDGSPLPLREAPEQEVQAALDRIKARNFVQNYQQPASYTFRAHASFVLRYYSKLAAFAGLKILRQDPYNLHYLVQPFVAQRKRLRDFVNDSQFHADWRDRLASIPGRPIYMPLAVVPEASTDYWIENKSFIDYNKTIVKLAGRLAKQGTVLVKEHGHMLGIRNRALYRGLRALDNVILVPPSTNSNELLSMLEPVVCVGGGSVGLEATIRGVPVVTYCTSSYWCAASGASVSNGEAEDIASKVAAAQQSNVSPYEFVKACLRTTIPVNLYQNRDGVAQNRQALVPFLDAGSIR